ncbi:MAG TPA: alpha/beta hydrolase, partial [Psychrobacter sp.]|nr:alpha/beta hydrolase [Psychrobacter sp.]
NAYKFKRAIPNSQLVVFDNLGHVPQEEDPEATAAAVMQFLQQSK